MLCCRRESNPYFKHGPQLDGLPDFGGNKLFAEVILKLVPQEGFEPPSDTLEECCLVQLDHCGINNFVKIYENLTPSGLHFRLSYDNGICCIMVQDLYDNTYFEMQYFTDINKALRFVNNL